VVCPIAGPPVAGGVIEIADGMVVDVHDRPHADTVNLGDVALLPGLVNCHTHLEFSNLAAPLGPPDPFATWISSVVAERRRRCRLDAVSADDRTERDPLARGLEECFHSGTSLVGDIETGLLNDSDQPAMIAQAIQEARLIPFRELISPKPAGIPATWRAADDSLRELESVAPGGRLGLSPHAPYTVTSDLLSQAVQRAVHDSRPLAMHVAETLEELELLQHRSGPLVEMLQHVDQWDPSAIEATSSMEILKQLSEAPQVLVVHGNYLAAHELRFLAEHPQMSLIYCPRTHAYFRHRRYPLIEAIQLGVNVALGTDSRASNPDLNLWEEVKEVARNFPSLEVATILKLATTNGARALGASSRHGVIEAGRSADLCCIQLKPGVADPLRAAVGRQAKVTGVMHSGRWIVRPGAAED
jgi:aminodeoxyfutalosine deaminase